MTHILISLAPGSSSVLKGKEDNVYSARRQAVLPILEEVARGLGLEE